MTEQDTIHELEDARQRDINAMLLAILLIERGHSKDAVQVLVERLPINLTRSLKAGKP